MDLHIPGKPSITCPYREDSIGVADIERRNATRYTWLGPIIFIILIDALQLQCLTHKFIDDTTLFEILRRGQSSEMNEVVEELVKWTEANKMRLNQSCPRVTFLGPGPTRRNVANPTRPAIFDKKYDPTRPAARPFPYTYSL